MKINIFAVLVSFSLFGSTLAAAQKEQPERVPPASSPYVAEGEEPVSRKRSQALDEELVTPNTLLFSGDATIVKFTTDANGNVDTGRLARNDQATIEQVIELIELNTGSLDEYGLTPSRVYRSPLSESSTRVVEEGSQPFELFRLELEQVLYGNKVSSLQVSVKSEGSQVSIQVDGVLVDPTLQAINPRYWINEAEAIDRAIAGLRTSPRNQHPAISFEDMVDDGSIKGELQFEIDQTSEGLKVRPIYQVRGDNSDARVNMYDGTTEVRTRQPRRSTTQVKTNVCRPGNDIDWPTCTVDASKPMYPQVYTVFGELGDGSRICADQPPFNQPVTAQCATMGYKEAHEVIRQSEDLLSDLYPSNCCGVMGQQVSFLGTTFRQLDIMLNSPSPGNSAAYFHIQGVPARAMIVIHNVYTSGQNAKGWRNLVGHEWSHAYHEYYGHPSGLDGLQYSLDIAGSSMAEGFSDIWAVILHKWRYNTASWSWRIDYPNNTYYIIPDDLSWHSDYVNDSDEIHENGRIFSSFFQRMQKKGIGQGVLTEFWLRFSRYLNKLDSGVTSSTQLNSELNVFDFAARASVEASNLSSTQRSKACDSWKGFDLRIDGRKTQICNAETPDNVMVTKLACVGSVDKSRLWGVGWENGKWLSWTEIETSINGGASWSTFDYDSDEVYDNYDVQNVTAAEGLMRARACRWSLTANNAKVCSAYTSSFTIYDDCDSAGG